MTQYFSNCISLDQAKSRWRQLSFAHHPDKGGDIAIMQDINRQYREFMLSFSEKESNDTSNETAAKIAEMVEEAVQYLRNIGVPDEILNVFRPEDVQVYYKIFGIQMDDFFKKKTNNKVAANDILTAAKLIGKILYK